MKVGNILSTVLKELNKVGKDSILVQNPKYTKVNKSWFTFTILQNKISQVVETFLLVHISERS